MALACAVHAAQATEAAHATLLPEGPVTLIRATTVYEVDAPLALEPGDLLATGPHASAQIECDDGSIAALAADTRVGIDATAGACGSLSLLSGWIKVARMHAAPGAWPIDTAAWRAAVSEGSAVVHTDMNAVSLFLENGSVALTLSGRGREPQLLSGERYLQRSPADAARPLDTAPRPAPDFIAAMPLPFRDPLGSIARRVVSKEKAPAAGRTASYADVGDWLISPLALRGTFVARFRPLAQAQPFRAQVRAHLRELPEWRRVLCPPAPPQRRPKITPAAPIESNASEDQS
ncbi:FecR domain-containing protein [Caballeronia sp. Lep1P3]|uniref:FecR domain-containing protein n=1 Tax=Caballeronia sp. Lep1P3 TaxID=2878150 RepID=UPI001FD22469|nr:FecR domain-containing protein [Caballeronia sp. Lep1P3]